MRLVDADEIRKKAVPHTRGDFGRYNSCIRKWAVLVGDIDDAPTVDAEEVVHAEWACVNESDNVWMCTGKNGCGNEILLLEGTPTENGWHYCPNCGAKMDGGNEDG